jgi:Transglutaminase-like superfamily
MAPLRLIRRLRRFAQVDNHHRALLIEASGWLLLVRLALIFIPFPRLARYLGTFVPPTDARTSQSATGSHNDIRVAEEVGWAVTRAARHLPLEAVCLPQAMAARIMLKRRGVNSVLHFGARMGQDRPIDAHAWLDAAGVQVTGYPVEKTLAEIACFV